MELTIAFQKEVKTKTFTSLSQTKAIQLWTKSKYFHVEMFINNHWYSCSPDKNGVFEKTLHELQDNYDYITINIDGRKYKKFLKFVKEQEGAGYDWLGIFLTQFINAKIEDREKWFCSEFIAAVLILFGILDDSKDPASYSPQDIYKYTEHLNIVNFN